MSNRSADDVLSPFHVMETPAPCSKQVGGRWPRSCDCGLDEAKQQLLADLLSLPEMQDEPHMSVLKDKKWHPAPGVMAKNELRTEIREALSQYFIGIVGGENGDSDSPELHEQQNVIKPVPEAPSKREDN